MRDNGHALNTTLPTIWSLSTDPIDLIRLSMDMARLSPSTKLIPSGTS